MILFWRILNFRGYLFVNLGFGCRRYESKTNYYIVAELAGIEFHRKYFDFDIDTYIENGSINNLRIEFDNSTNKWQFYHYDTLVFIDTTEFAPIFHQDQFWTNVNGEGNLGFYFGETYNLEDDMPGFPDDSCEYTYCKFRKGNDTFRVITTNNNAGSYNTDINRFGAERIDTCTFVTWDKFPQ